jgi:hypothetical protein
MAQIYKNPVQAYIMPRKQALNVEPHVVGQPKIDTSDGHTLLLDMLKMCEARGIELKAWIPDLLVELAADERPKQWAASAVRELIEANPDKNYGIVVFASAFGPTLAVLADNGISAKTEVVSLS